MQQHSRSTALPALGRFQQSFELARARSHYHLVCVKCARVPMWQTASVLVYILKARCGPCCTACVRRMLDQGGTLQLPSCVAHCQRPSMHILSIQLVVFMLKAISVMSIQTNGGNVACEAPLGLRWPWLKRRTLAAHACTCLKGTWPTNLGIHVPKRKTQWLCTTATAVHSSLAIMHLSGVAWASAPHSS